MLEKIQKFRRLTIWLIVIVLSIALVGISDFFVFSKDNKTALKVNGEKITWRMIDDASQRLQMQYKDKIDAKTLKEHARNTLIQRIVLLSAAKKLGFKVADQQIAEFIIQVPVFKVDGKFSKERYLQVLKEAGMTDASFRDELAQDILLGQLSQGLTASSFSLFPELARLVELVEQRRDIGFAKISPQKFKDGIHPTKKEISEFYENHQSAFVEPEQVALQYVQLNLDDLIKNVEVDDSELEAYYEEHKDSYGAPERVHARHILIEASQNASAEENKLAKEKIAMLQEKLKNGEKFEDLAKKHSVDQGSAEKGGDLGWFSKGQMVPEFEKAVFSLREPNSIAEPVRSPYGYHLIQLIEYKPAETRPFSEIKSLVKEQIQKEKALVLFIEKGEQMAKLAFEHPNTLSPIVEQMGLKLEKTELFARQGGKKKPSTSPDVIKAAFSDSVLKQAHNSEVIKLGDNAMVVVHLIQHQPSKQQTLAEVEKTIEGRIIDDQASKKAKDYAELIANKIRAGENPKTLAQLKEKGVAWTVKKEIGLNNSELDRNIVASAFQFAKPDSDKTPSLRVISQPTGEYIILAVSAVHEGDVDKIDEKTRKDYRQGLANAFSQTEFALYANSVISQAKVEMGGQQSAGE